MYQIGLFDSDFSQQLLMSLEISPYKGYLTRNTQLLSKMDPYVQLKFGTQRKTTAVQYNAGGNVDFPDIFTFRPEGSMKMTVRVFDKDATTSDEIGSGHIDLSYYFQGQVGGIESVSLRYNNKPAGKVMLRITKSKQKQQEDIHRDRLLVKLFTIEHIQEKKPKRQGPKQYVNLL